MFFFASFISLLMQVSLSVYSVNLRSCSCILNYIVFIKKKLGICCHHVKGLFFLRVALALLLLITLAPTTKTYSFGFYRNPSGAMKPTILTGDYIIANKLSYILRVRKRNEVIICQNPKDPIYNSIKRVVGIGGDLVEIRDKQLFVNGKAADSGFHIDSKIYPREKSPRDNYGPVTVPRDALFVLGDNRDYSFDSRFWGFVPLDLVIAQVYFIYWSQDPKIRKIRTDRIGKWIK